MVTLQIGESYSNTTAEDSYSNILYIAKAVKYITYMCIVKHEPSLFGWRATLTQQRVQKCSTPVHRLIPEERMGSAAQCTLSLLLAVTFSGDSRTVANDRIALLDCRHVRLGK